MAVMTDGKFVSMAKKIATDYKTLYIYGCFGSPMNATNKKRYTNNYAYNKQPSRAAKINAASSDTFGFDCVCLIKGILWGWNGDVNKTYGGAVYKSNGVPDTSADGMMRYCTDISTDFNNIVVGEVVHMSGHIGIYIGDGLAVECTPIWKDGVQITAVGNIGKKKGYNTRTWTNHGKLTFIDYSGSSEDEKIKEFLAPRGYLKKGDTGKSVETLCDFFSKKVAGNYYGDYLEACVKVFQKQNGLEVDGYNGPLTTKAEVKDGMEI